MSMEVRWADQRAHDCFGMDCRLQPDGEAAAVLGSNEGGQPFAAA